MHRRDLVKSGMAAVAAGALRIPPHRLRQAAIRPTTQQLAWQAAELGIFFHFGINTYTDREWGLGNEDPPIFNPASLDARQWVRAAQSAGAKYVVLTAKHHDGFCLWPSKTTAHSVASSPWKAGKGDVVREVADAARAAGLGLGLYLSPWDRNAPSYGSGAGYMNFYIAQLTELLTNYGQVMEVWFDGANGEGPNGKKQTYDWPRIHSTVRRLQPNALMFSDSGPDIRWNGNERGRAGDPNWCTVDPSVVTHPGMDGPHIIAALQNGNPPPQGTVWRPSEADVSIRPGWFHHPAEDARVKTVEQLREIWFDSVGRNANLLLNVPPNRDGRISDEDAGRLALFGTRLRDYWAGAIDRTPAQLMAPLDGALHTVDFNGTTRVGGVELGEDLAQGQMVSKFHVDVMVDGAWMTVANGTTIGHKRVVRFTPVIASQCRLLIEDAVAKPTIRTMRVALA
ncbi:MAG: alpha-L-fucosidase [Gemmatimonadota bacterium]|nr:alpha-L-fucosidase [Gemmatimonadota bacterium]